MTMQEMKSAQAALEARGWTFAASVVHKGDKTNNRFGLLYFKREDNKRKEFWLNLNTFDKIPV